MSGHTKVDTEVLSYAWNMQAFRYNPLKRKATEITYGVDATSRSEQSMYERSLSHMETSDAMRRPLFDGSSSALIKERLGEFKTGSPILCQTGWNGHAVSITFQLVKGSLIATFQNRQEDDAHFTVIRCLGNLNVEILKTILSKEKYRFEKEDEVNYLLMGKLSPLRPKVIAKQIISPQKEGICFYEAIWGNRFALELGRSINAHFGDQKRVSANAIKQFLKSHQGIKATHLTVKNEKRRNRISLAHKFLEEISAANASEARELIAFLLPLTLKVESKLLRYRESNKTDSDAFREYNALRETIKATITDLKTKHPREYEKLHTEALFNSRVSHLFVNHEGAGLSTFEHYFPEANSDYDAAYYEQLTTQFERHMYDFGFVSWKHLSEQGLPKMLSLQEHLTARQFSKTKEAIQAMPIANMGRTLHQLPQLLAQILNEATLQYRKETSSWRLNFRSSYKTIQNAKLGTPDEMITAVESVLGSSSIKMKQHLANAFGVETSELRTLVQNIKHPAVQPPARTASTVRDLSESAMANDHSTVIEPARA